MISIQKYVRAQSLEEAYQLNQQRTNRILGGMLWMQMSKGNIHTAIDLCDLGLNTIEETEEAFLIGAMVTLRDLEMHSSLNAYADNAVRNAVKDIVGVQFRNMATIGGSIWSRFGFSDVLTVFLAMDAYVELYKDGLIPLAQFIEMKYNRDILLRVVVKKTPGHFVYTAMRKQRTDFPVISCAVSRIGGEYRAVIGARPGRAMIVRDEQGILAEGISTQTADAFARYVAANVPTGSNVRASAEYRRHLIRVLAGRSISELGGDV
ncbi:MAG: FAD binding domain-containing protein [Clostridia bacterium]|nr:FAD binding domain-containing protein [Clostridia bacterium]